MDIYLNILKSSIKIAYNHKRTCLLGLMQFFAVYLAIKLLNDLSVLKISYTLLTLLIISLTTVFLWKYIEAIKINKLVVADVKNQFNLIVKFSSVLSLLFVLFFLVKQYNLLWNYSVIIGCLVTLMVCYILLGVVLLNLSITKAYFCTLDFIKNKFGVFYSIFITLVLVNIFSYYFVHLLINIRVLEGGFSVFTPSATIWVVFLGVALLATFFSGVINIFLVLLFLEISKTIKAPTEIETPLVPAQYS